MRAPTRGDEVPLYDDGEQTRDFTFCSDIVNGIVAGALYPGSGDVFNLGGGTETSLLGAIAMIEKITGLKAKLKRFDRQKGDVRHTHASIEAAKGKLGYAPRVRLEEGLSQEWDWIKTLGY
jgi:UDP-glucose 4-epimerase